MVHIKINAGDANSIEGIPVSIEAIDGLNVNTLKSLKTVTSAIVIVFSEKNVFSLLS